MSNLHKSKQCDLIDMFNDTSRYLDDIFTINNPEFEKHIPDIYRTERQLNKANTSDKETSFLNLNIKVAVMFIPSFTTNAMTLVYLSSISSISEFVRFARCCTTVSDFHSKNLQITSKLLTQGYRYHNLLKNYGKFSYLLSKFEISLQKYVSEGISQPVFYGDLVYKLRRVKCEANFVSSF